jgi:glyoxylase-like metal-dependent hydrolase (beta-lactamase superfamily II)
MTNLLAATLALGLMSIAPAGAAAAAAPLQIDVYNPLAAGIFPVSSSIVSGPHEAVLVDAQFARRDALALVERIKATGKTLTTIYVSHGDPDYYFGLQHLQDAFPNAKIVATPQTVAKIQAGKDGKLAHWGPILKDQAPTRIVVPEPLRGDTLLVDGQALRIMGLEGDTPERSFLWIEANRSLLGGVPVMANMHLWVADTPTSAARASWLKTLSQMAALQPAQVVPGHYLPNPDGSQSFDAKALEFTRDYLVAFEHEATRAADAKALVAAMTARYTALGAVPVLELGAKVVKGELNWPEGTPVSRYAAIGKQVQVGFGDMVFVLDFKDDRTMSFVGTAGAYQGATDTVQYTAVAIRPQVYMVHWREPKVGSRVVHLQDFEKGVVHTNIAQPNGDFINLTGSLKLLDTAR